MTIPSVALRVLRRWNFWIGVACLGALNPIQSFAQTATQLIKLNQGWNLIAFEVLPANPTPASVLDGLSADPATVVAGCGVTTQRFDASA